MADIPNAVSIAPGLAVPDTLLHFTYTRSGGPGGQNVNKLNTKAVLAVAMDELAPHIGAHAAKRLRRLAANRIGENDQLTITADEERSQRANQKACIEKLRKLILLARARPKVRKPTRPTRASRERRIESKKRRGQIKRRRSQRDF